MGKKVWTYKSVEYRYLHATNNETPNHFCLAVGLAVQGVAHADTLPTNSLNDSTVANANALKMKALRKQVDDAEAVYKGAVTSRKPDDQVSRYWDAYTQIDQTNLPIMFDLARQRPESEAAFEIFGWIVTNRCATGWALSPIGEQTVGYLRDYHTTNPGIAKICRAMGGNWDPTFQPATDFLQMAADKNPDREVRGQAILALARRDKDNATTLEYYSESAPPGDTRFATSKRDYWAKEKDHDPDNSSREAEKLFNLVLDKNADCPTLQRTNTWQVKATLGEEAKAELYELDHLSAGKVAPDVEGEDINGKTLKLRDYRGKIVMLSFWASWCGPCMVMVPAEVRLAERMKGKPFEIVGVNGDAIQSDAVRAVEREKYRGRLFIVKKVRTALFPQLGMLTAGPRFI